MLLCSESLKTVRNWVSKVCVLLAKIHKNKTNQENVDLPGSSTRMAGVLLIADAGSVGRRVVGA